MYYKVKATFYEEKLKAFFLALNDGSIASQEPDGKTIVKAMQEAKVIEPSTIAWVEECYCSSPLKHERETVYDKYLSHFSTEFVEKSLNDIEGESFWEMMEKVYYDRVYSY
jgi:hypothetical protein